MPLKECFLVFISFLINLSFFHLRMRIDYLIMKAAISVVLRCDCLLKFRSHVSSSLELHMPFVDKFS